MSLASCFRGFGLMRMKFELLRGFLEYTTQRGLNTSSQQHHYDTTAFYKQIKSKFQLDFNKNQIVEVNALTPKKSSTQRFISILVDPDSTLEYLTFLKKTEALATHSGGSKIYNVRL
ncbi:hypothetical protein H5410_011526 [Solanum commersonii]|uniref:Uncharacterized protein n=1 Tax=Solanum commersonii TaxID=4109 RepID=A0A9J6APM0_SOLCO|nr:hypothetical protein H5410_011526 [Solanum commersonii]